MPRPLFAHPAISPVIANTTTGYFQMTISPTPPSPANNGDLWWRNDPDGMLFIYYNDGSSAQWVPAVPQK